ncbi:SAM-dependent methyltransferase [Streptoalloteichus tenebrarius]|uniref:SAM-dependent methyltransferase n=1 Tax=Streptoalloteichus tenebrarius (strain ATCC 17920 / DSM 40477 / JCM 4838 / CBS 697.72 / NBRC 16177 / NCIMB 11028 / NRRL B-12390 / A12253. 1 / ISP 5477) TaxID=1933 RepID=UPI0020A44F9D|nr:SAM-dependent methyltransferase [Streptoalloteichus tenebrarius]BFF02286.1 SAM-dependent methyltransferase [Streptoalloteichus tenebrarius]
MTTGPRPLPAQVDLDRPSAARVHDYWLGGSHNFAVDRELAERAERIVPELPAAMREYRAFLRRAVRFCLDSGVRQFLDLGSGIPTVGNVHEVARAVDPAVRVVYVDRDPVAVSHSRVMLADVPDVDVLHADLRDPERVLDSPEVAGLLDLDHPVAVLMVSSLHFVPDSDDPAGVIGRYREAMAPGSHLVLAHATGDSDARLVGEQAARVAALYRRSADCLTLRSRAEVTALLTGFALVEPGVTRVPDWRPDTPRTADEHPHRNIGYAGVGRRV